MAKLSKELLEDNGLSELIELCGSFVILRHSFLYFVHQSAKDYLVSDGAQKLFPNGFQKYHGLVVSHSLDAMSRTLRRDICNLKYPGSPPRKGEIHTCLEAICYACSFWLEHLAYYLNDSPDCIRYKEYMMDHGRVHNFLLKHFLHWVEALGLVSEVDRGIRGLQRLERMFERLATQQAEIPIWKDFVHDAVRILRQFRPAIEEAPLQVYCATLIFSPETSLVRQNFKQEIARWISPLPRVRTEWGPSLQTLEGHTDRITLVVFSPNGQQLASCSDDRTVRVWDTASGACLQTLRGYTNWVRSVVFSSNGRQLASCSNDDTVQLWDTALGACLQTLRGHTDLVRSVVFSPNSQQLASCSNDRTVRVWDTASGACLQTLEGHTFLVNSVVFSPNGQQLASCSDDCTVRVWDAASGTCLQTLEGDTSTIAFGRSGSNIVTDFGVLSVGHAESDTAPKQIGLSIGSEKWITWNGDNILWLPPEYRRESSAAEENRIAVGCSSGVTYILNFHPDNFPN